MIELINKINSFKDSLDSSNLFNELELSFCNIKKNTELINKINKYNNTFSNDLRLNIYNYEEIKKYKECENNINLLILEINSKLKVISSNRSCINENN